MWCWVWSWWSWRHLKHQHLKYLHQQTCGSWNATCCIWAAELPNYSPAGSAPADTNTHELRFPHSFTAANQKAGLLADVVGDWKTPDRCENNKNAKMLACKRYKLLNLILWCKVRGFSGSISVRTLSSSRRSMVFLASSSLLVSSTISWSIVFLSLSTFRSCRQGKDTALVHQQQWRWGVGTFRSCGNQCRTACQIGTLWR